MLQAAEDDAERIGFGLTHPENMCLDAVSQVCNTITPVEVTSTDLRFVEVTPAYGTKDVYKRQLHRSVGISTALVDLVSRDMAIRSRS